MATKGTKTFFTLSIIFYVLLSFYLCYSVYSIRCEEFDKSSEAASVINSEIDSGFSVDYSFSSKYFLNSFKDIFDRYPTLSGIIIYSNANGPEYIKLKSASILDNNPSNGATNNWTPSINISHPLMKEYRTKIYFNNDFNAHAVLVFDLLNRKLFFPILRNTLIAALLYLILTAVYLAASKEKNNTDNLSNLSTSTSTFAETLDNEFSEPSIEPGLPIETETEILNDTSTTNSSGMYSDRSGLVWAHFLNEKLEAELKRAASFDQDSCLVFVSIISPSGFIPYRNIAELIIEHFKYKDLAFESGDNTFCIIIPDKDIDEGLHDVELFRKSIIARFPESSYRVYAGLTSRNSRLLSEKRMVHEAKAALARAESEPESTTISFRTDLNKYREYIASHL